MPKDSYTIGNGYGPREAPITGASTFHLGVDLGAPKGTPIYAVADGYAKTYKYPNCPWGPGYGDAVIIWDGNIAYITAHMDGFAIGNGPVEKDQLIGYVGTTGTSKDYHVHFEVRIDGVAVSNPKSYIR